MKTILASDWAPRIEAAVRNTAAVLAAIYTAGYMLGKWIHQLNDAFAAMTKPAPAPIAPPAVHPLALLADELQGTTVKQLKALTGIKRRTAKADLIAALVAC